MENNNNSILVCNGEFQIVKITENLYDEAVDIFKNCFMRYENVCMATNLVSSKQSIQEMEILIRSILKQRISFAALSRQTGEMAAMCVNSVINPSAHCTMDDVFEKFTSPGMQTIGEYLHCMEFTVDLFREWNIDCLFQIEFLSTRPHFGGKGLATILSQHSVEYARQMADGTLPETEKLPKIVQEQRPGAVTSVFTSYFTQKIGEKLGFVAVCKIKYTEFSYDGKNFAESIDPIHEYSVFGALRL